jgi:hypothetical protein
VLDLRGVGHQGAAEPLSLAPSACASAYELFLDAPDAGGHDREYGRHLPGLAEDHGGSSATPAIALSWGRTRTGTGTVWAEVEAAVRYGPPIAGLAGQDELVSDTDPVE